MLILLYSVDVHVLIVGLHVQVPVCALIDTCIHVQYMHTCIIRIA